MRHFTHKQKQKQMQKQNHNQNQETSCIQVENVNRELIDAASESRISTHKLRLVSRH